MHDPSHGVLRALQELAEQWRGSIVAEGVETAAQLAVVRSLGISAGQGYLLAGPRQRCRPRQSISRRWRCADQGDFAANDVRRADNRFGSQPTDPGGVLTTFHAPGRDAPRSKPAPRLAPHDERAETAPEIRLIDLAKHFREVRAVDGVSPRHPSGEFFSLLGPSGCGKTTTLRMIGGFELPTAGRILLRGRDVTNDPPDKRPVNMVFQNYALFPHLDVGDNIAFGLRRRNVERTEIARRVGEALDLVRPRAATSDASPTSCPAASSSASRWPARSSTGPTCCSSTSRSGALDLKLRKQLQVELKRVQAEVGITFVYVTHDQEEALTMSDRIAVMNRGRVEQLGTPEELYERPRTRFVADFIGTTNLLTGSVESSRPARPRSSASTSGDRVSWPAAARRRASRSSSASGPNRSGSGRQRRNARRAAAHRRHGRAGRLPRGQRPVHRPHERRTRHHRPRRRRPATDSRSAAPSTSAGRRPRP